MNQAKFLFGDIVVVDTDQIGVVVKTWQQYTQESGTTHSYDVYVRSYNCVSEYKESDIERYRVRHKYLDEEELVWQNS